jgi:hypothetical protein
MTKLPKNLSAESRSAGIPEVWKLAFLISIFPGGGLAVLAELNARKLGTHVWSMSIQEIVMHPEIVFPLIGCISTLILVVYLLFLPRKARPDGAATPTLLYRAKPEGLLLSDGFIFKWADIKTLGYCRMISQLHIRGQEPFYLIIECANQESLIAFKEHKFQGVSGEDATYRPLFGSKKFEDTMMRFMRGYMMVSSVKNRFIPMLIADSQKQFDWLCTHTDPNQTILIYWNPMAHGSLDSLMRESAKYHSRIVTPAEIVAATTHL